VIERDALARWGRLSWTERNDSRLDLSSADNSLAAGPLDLLERAGFDVLLWDITSDIGVAAFHCLILDREDPAGHPGTGTGCHLDKEVALCRAILEAVQVRAVYISGGRDDLRRREYEIGHIAAFRRAAGAGDRAPRRPLAEIPSVETECFEDDLAYVLERLPVCGLPSPIVVDLSRPDSGIAVVRVVAPGLEGPQDTAPTEVLA
jgi:ribosomal protein S12 methylthiotransferase accessory factor